MMRCTRHGKEPSFRHFTVHAIGILLSLVCAWPPPDARAAAEPSRPTPILRPVRVFEDGVWFFDFDGPRGSEIPALTTLVSDDKSKTERELLRHYVFGNTIGANRPSSPLRWDIADGILYCTYTFDAMGRKPTPSIFRYRLKNLIARPDNGRGAQDERTYSSPVYASCAPIGAHRTGLAGWNIGDALARDGLHVSGPPRDIYYDLRALDEVRLELYMTADGKLSRWLFDGKEWRLRKNYTTEIEGPFLVCNNGTSLVAGIDGRWCLLKGIDTDNPSVAPIVDVSETKPLRLIEDRSTRKAFFELDGDIFDEAGKRIARIPDGIASQEQVTEIVRTIRSRRD